MITQSQIALYRSIKQLDWFTNATLVEESGVSRPVVAQFTRLLSQHQVLERIDLKPAPLFRLSDTDVSEPGKQLLEELEQALLAVAS
ncbi:hypothetical protein IFO70_22185 [Phormidium tenue FACHB-886]|nr:hypothetical protein [Phormidium tenue FACHB-886]